MSPLGMAIGTLFVLWIGLHLKKSRPDGDLVEGVHPYRRLMAYIMPTRSESTVFLDGYVDAGPLLSYLEKARNGFGADMTHCLVAASAMCMAHTPQVNRFVVGRRLYQRRGVWVTFSMKRKALDRAAKLATVKLELRPGETFRDLCARINQQIDTERSGRRTYADKEFDLLGALPRPLLRAGVRLTRVLDYFNLLPASFIENDPLYTSMFVANLGSLGMDPGYHHLYEWGTCPSFMMAGRMEERPIVVDGKVVVRTVLPLRFTYDERVDDGLSARHAIEVLTGTLARPFEYLGCVEEDGSDAIPLDRPPSERCEATSEASAVSAAAR